MSVAPTQSPAMVAQEARRARLAVLAVTVGIAAMLFAYAIAPGVRHAVSHAAHSVKHAVSHVFDPDGSTKAVRAKSLNHPGASGHSHSPSRSGSASGLKVASRAKTR